MQTHRGRGTQTATATPGESSSLEKALGPPSHLALEARATLLRGNALKMCVEGKKKTRHENASEPREDERQHGLPTRKQRQPCLLRSLLQLLVSKPVSNDSIVLHRY